MHMPKQYTFHIILCKYTFIGKVNVGTTLIHYSMTSDKLTKFQLNHINYYGVSIKGIKVLIFSTIIIVEEFAMKTQLLLHNI